jgi:RNA polymerase sigma factor (sigma-70 family)
MTVQHAGIVLRHVRQVLTVQESDRLPDRELLRRFAHRRDEAAFGGLVRRHGPMVAGVCRRVLCHRQDAEDAFQATFLVLARKAGARHWLPSVGPWLYRVAYRIALRARAQRSRDCTAVLAVPADQDPLAAAAARELSGALDEELSRLPSSCRAALVLCNLEGRSRDDAARVLGWSLGTLKRRLERARALLRSRLARRGFAPAAPLALALAAPEVGTAALAPPLVQAALAGARAVGPMLCACEVPTRVVTLAAGAVWGNGFAQLHSYVSACLLACVAGVAVTYGLAAVGGSVVEPVQAPDVPRASTPAAADENRQPATDRYSDPLPDGAIARLGTVRFRHGGLTTSVVFSPDGTSITTMGVDGLRAWDVETGKSLNRLGDRDDRHLQQGILSPNGKVVVSLEMTGRLQRPHLWDVGSGKLVRAFDADHPCAGGCFSPDGAVLVTFGTSQPGDIRWREFGDLVAVWDVAGGRQVRSWKAHEGGTYCGVFTPDGKTLLTGGGDNAVRFWDPATGRESRPPLEGTAPAGHVVLSPGGTMLAVIPLKNKFAGGGLFPAVLAWTADNKVFFWDLASGKQVQWVTVPEQRIVSGFTGVAFALDGKAAWTGGVDRFARLWDLATGKELRCHDLGHPGVWTFAASPDRKVLAGLPGGSTVRLIDAESGKDLSPADGHRHEVRHAFLTPDGRTAVTAARGEAAAAVWDATTGLERLRLEGHQPYIGSVLSFRDGRTFYTVGHGDGTIIAWDAATGNPLRRLPQPNTDQPPYTAALSPSGMVLALAARGPTVVLVDTETGKVAKRLHDDALCVIDAAFADDGTLVVFSDDRSISFWDVATGAKRRDLLPPGVSRHTGGQVRLRGHDAVALSRDGRLAACVRPDGAPAVFELATGVPVCAGSARKAGVNVFAFSPDGRTLAFGGDERDRVIYLLEVATGKERARLTGHTGGIACLAFAPDGRRLISGSGDTSALVWDVNAGPGARREKPTPEVLGAWWVELADEDAPRAYRAVRRLADSADASVPFLRGKLKKVSAPDEARIACLIADLDSNEFRVRDNANRELQQFGEAAVGLYHKALRGDLGLEPRRRLEALVGEMSGRRHHPPPELLQGVRAVETLEMARTREARQVLETIAGGAPESLLTQEAKASLERLKG